MASGIRKILADDIPAIVNLSEQKRTQYEAYQPLFWRKAADSRERQEAFLPHLLARENVIGLLHETDGETDGFVIAALVPSPPVYAAGLTISIDDFCVTAQDWSGIGQMLLDAAVEAAREQGAAQCVVVCGHLDQPKRAMLAALGYTIASEWWTKPVAAAPVSETETPTDQPVRMQAMEAARSFVDRDFPGCLAAFLGGSVVRGEATATSDLDIVIIADAVYRESLHAFGWPIEVFVHTPESYKEFFASDAKRRRPSLPKMCAEGRILKDCDGIAVRIQAEAQELLDKGPAPISEKELLLMRYNLTDTLDDFLGSVRSEETLFIAPSLAQAAVELILLSQRKWLGRGKWIPRALNQFDPRLTAAVTTALEAFYRKGDREPLAIFARQALGFAGGPLFDGFSLGEPGSR